MHACQKKEGVVRYFFLIHDDLVNNKQFEMLNEIKFLLSYIVVLHFKMEEMGEASYVLEVTII